MKNLRDKVEAKLVKLGNFTIGQRVQILSSGATGSVKSIKTHIIVVSLDPEFIEKGKNCFPDIKSKIVKSNNLKPLV